MTDTYTTYRGQQINLADISLEDDELGQIVAFRMSDGSMIHATADYLLGLLISDTYSDVYHGQG